MHSQAGRPRWANRGQASVRGHGVFAGLAAGLALVAASACGRSASGANTVDKPAKAEAKAGAVTSNPRKGDPSGGAGGLPGFQPVPFELPPKGSPETGPRAPGEPSRPGTTSTIAASATGTLIATCSATVTNPQPNPGSVVTLGVAGSVANADVAVAVAYRTGDVSYRGHTDLKGRSTIAFPSLSAPQAYTAPVKVVVGGQASCQTIFLVPKKAAGTTP